MAKITAVDGNVKVEDATVEETITPVEDVVVEPEETIDSDFSVDNTEESYDEDVMPLPSVEEDATPVYNGDVAQQSSETIGKKWNEYTTGTDLDDTDELMILDTSAKANKRTLLSKLSDYVLGKLADKVFEKLETQNKTILGALNELNSKALKPFYSGYISNTPLTIKLSIGLYFITTYRSGGYKISSLSVLNIQIDNGSFLETLVKGEDYDATVKMDCTENGLSANYKIKLSGNCAIKIYKVCQ